MVSSSSLGSLRRTRGLSSGGSVVSCLVEGCASDLSKCREYHRRHKVCDVHSKSVMVMVGGREQRFCQQCSRFHLLMEFDEAKRSCRKRLEGHNRRRRKPPLNTINSRSFATSYQGSRFTPYPHTFSLTTPKSSWSTVIKEEEAPAYTSRSSLDLRGVHSNYEHFPVSSRGSFKIGKQFPFLQGNAEASIGSMSTPLLKSISAAAEQSHCSKLYDSDCALSLLSLPAARSTSVNNLGQVTDSGDTIPIGQPLIPAVRLNGSQGAFNNKSHTVSSTGFSYSGLEHEHLGTVLISDSNGLFQVGVGGSSDGSQTLSFSWQ